MSFVLAALAAQCWVVDVDFTPSEDLQIVVWLEDAAGNYVDTLYITDLTGQRGLGNRPGRIDFNSGPLWPYGRRENTFPVWAHRHGMSWPKVYFQNDDASHGAEDNLSHPFDESSAEQFFCRPLRESEAAWDAQTCASTIYTDKGVLSDTEISLYPPRADIQAVDGTDDPSVAEFEALNPFDAVSAATPIGGHRRRVFWSVPDDLVEGDYVAFVEVAKEFDHNDVYNPASYPEPSGILYREYGVPYRGQPSVVYRVPFEIGPELSVGTTTTFTGYGNPAGQDGVVRPPDGTIETTVVGSGGSRLLETVVGDETYRVRAMSRIIQENEPPGAPIDGAPLTVTHQSATVSFVEPDAAPSSGTIQGFEVRYRAGDPMTEGNFFESSPTMQPIDPVQPGALHLVTLEGLLPRTHYYVGIRAFDDCQNYGPLELIEVVTPERPVGEVDACFVATAAYGSLMANDVTMLRHVRDVYLRSNVLGELLVEAYYTFGPALAGVIGESEDLRGIARDLLDPIVDRVRDAVY